jgi:hypothetical protein
MSTNYTALHIVEFEEDCKTKDSKMIILFDESEQKYYLYGTRRPLILHKCSCTKLVEEFDDYKFVYDYSRLNSLVSFIQVVGNNLNEQNTIFSIELYHITVYDYELEDLSYKYLIEKLDSKNEIVAYDEQKLDKDTLKKIIKILTSTY